MTLEKSISKGKVPIELVEKSNQNKLHSNGRFKREQKKKKNRNQKKINFKIKMFVDLFSLLIFFSIQISGGRIGYRFVSISKSYIGFRYDTTARKCHRSDKTMQMDMWTDWWPRICCLFSARFILHTNVGHVVFLLAHLPCGRSNDTCHQSRI